METLVKSEYSIKWKMNGPKKYIKKIKNCKMAIWKYKKKHAYRRVQHHRNRKNINRSKIICNRTQFKTNTQRNNKKPNHTHTK